MNNNFVPSYDYVEARVLNNIELKFHFKETEEYTPRSGHVIVSVLARPLDAVSTRVSEADIKWHSSQHVSVLNAMRDVALGNVWEIQYGLHRLIGTTDEVAVSGKLLYHVSREVLLEKFPVLQNLKKGVLDYYADNVGKWIPTRPGQGQKYASLKWDESAPGMIHLPGTKQGKKFEVGVLEAKLEGEWFQVESTPMGIAVMEEDIHNGNSSGTTKHGWIEALAVYGLPIRCYPVPKKYGESHDISAQSNAQYLFWLTNQPDPVTAAAEVRAEMFAQKESERLYPVSDDAWKKNAPVMKTFKENGVDNSAIIKYVVDGVTVESSILSIQPGSKFKYGNGREFRYDGRVAGMARLESIAKQNTLEKVV